MTSEDGAVPEAPDVTALLPITYEEPHRIASRQRHGEREEITPSIPRHCCTRRTSDRRMNDRSTSKTFEFRNGAWPNVSDGKMTLSNGSSCIVDVNYSFEAVKK